MTIHEYELIKQLFSMSQNQLMVALPKFLSKYYNQKDIIRKKDYIYIKGEIPVGLVAHLDTVHRQPVKQLFHDSEKKVFWSPQGLGADDRAGVFSILNVIERGYKPTIIFCCDEEAGGQGAYNLTKEFQIPPNELNFLIELDRQGKEDSVYYNLDNLDFEDYINSFGFITDVGTFSDIYYLAPAWKIAAVNLSIGYYNEHSYAEYLYYPSMFNTIQKVCNILEAEMVEPHKFEYIEFNYSTLLKYGYQKCDNCEGYFKKDKMLHFIQGGYQFHFCEECSNASFIRRCENCGKYFISDKEIICDECMEHINGN